MHSALMVTVFFVQYRKGRYPIMSRIDIAIIGSGPAGLEAALTAKNRNKNVQVYGTKELSAKIQAIVHPITNYLGMNRVTGKQMAEAFQEQITEAGITIEDQKITSVYAMGDYFMLQKSDGNYVEASTVILATGVTPGRPYPGETDFLGRGVSYCATCDAPLYKGKDVIVIGGSPKEEEEADFLGEVCSSVLYIPLYTDEPHFHHENVTVERIRPQSIMGTMKADTLITDQGERKADGIFVLRESQFPSQMVPGLNVEGNAVTVDRQMRTNIPGLFAAGDITGLPYQFTKSAGEGNVAAISAAMYLDAAKRNL